jgi:hypothetical protein
MNNGSIPVASEVVDQFDLDFKKDDLRNTFGVNYQALMATSETDPLPAQDYPL